MPVERVPGFWDYLTQGVNKGLDQSRENQQIKREEARQNATLMTHLFETGAVDSPDLQSGLAGVGIKTPVQASKTERRRQIIAQGQGAVDALSDAEKEDLGFKTNAQKKIEAGQVSAADIEVRKNDALGRFMSGDKLNDQEREMFGFMSDSDRELKKLTAMDPYLGGLGERHVAGELIKNQGRIPKGGAAALAENAYANYVSERSTNGLGGLTPEQVAYTRSYFQRAAQNALIAQQKMDLEKYQAESGRIGANSQAQQRGLNSNLQWFGKITTAMDTVRKQQQDLLRANPALAVALDNPQLASSPMIKGAMERYSQLEQTAEAFRGAQGSLAEGNVPGNLGALLEAADGMVVPPKPAGAGGQPGQPGAAPAALAKPAGPPPGPTQGVQPDLNQKIEATAQALAKGQIGAASLDPYILTGAMTQDDKKKILDRAAKIKDQMEKDRMKGVSADTFSSGGVRQKR